MRVYSTNHNTAPDPKITFDEIDADGGGQILFVEFCEWALSRNLLSHAPGDDEDGEVTGGSDQEAESDGKTMFRGYGKSARFARGAALGRARSIDANVDRPQSASFSSSSLEQPRSSIDHEIFRLKQMSGARSFGLTPVDCAAISFDRPCCVARVSMLTQTLLAGLWDARSTSAQARDRHDARAARTASVDVDTMVPTLGEAFHYPPGFFRARPGHQSASPYSPL
jgi:hypothetical protein